MLGVALVLEVLVLIIFDFGVFTAKSGTSFTTEALNILHVMTPVTAQKVGTVDIAAGAAAVGVFMAFWSWVGFEMAPNYAEESRDPKRIVPLSLYISVIGLGVFYTITSWAAVSAFPTQADMLAKAVSRLEQLLHQSRSRRSSVRGRRQLMGILIMTSAFACGMAFHNTTARYIYSLAREGVLPKVFGSTHDSFKSPHIASILQTVLAAIWVGAFAYFLGTNDPNAQAYLGRLHVAGDPWHHASPDPSGHRVDCVIAYFRMHHSAEAGGFSTLIAPLIAFVAQVYLVYLLVAEP